VSFAGRLGWRAHARGWALVAVVASSGLAPAAAHAHDAVSPPVCDELAAAAWPRTAADRRALLQRLESARETCKDHPLSWPCWAATGWNGGRTGAVGWNGVMLQPVGRAGRPC
jgi:hypothetical protein